MMLNLVLQQTGIDTFGGIVETRIVTPPPDVLDVRIFALIEGFRYAVTVNVLPPYPYLPHPYRALPPMRLITRLEDTRWVGAETDAKYKILGQST